MAEQGAARGEGSNMLLVGAYGGLFALWAISYAVLVPVWANVIGQTFFIIYIGCCHSLPALNKRLDHGEGATEEKEGEPALTAKDAAWFPIYGSVMLFSLYIAFKFFDKDTVNLLLAVYFSLIGVFTLAGLFDKSFFSSFLGSTASSPRYGFEAELPVLGPIGGKYTLSEWVAVIPAAVVAGAYFKTKHWMLNNLLGIAFSVTGIEAISLGSYKVGAILLGGLFFYDIFWVFGTEVMVSVAKGVDGPIKLLFPRSFKQIGAGPDGADVAAEFSMLGLGDIVIPGIFIAMILRFDAMRALSATISRFTVHTTFPSPTFWPTMVAYSMGLGTTLFVMFYFQAAQPALLYLVPACLCSSLGAATVGGYTKDLFKYSEEDEEATEEAGVAKDAKKAE